MRQFEIDMRKGILTYNDSIIFTILCSSLRHILGLCQTFTDDNKEKEWQLRKNA